MASTDPLGTFRPSAGNAPAASQAALGVRSGGSTPGENLSVLEFDAASSQYYDFYHVMPQNYDGGGVTLVIHWAAKTAAGGADDVRFEAAFRALEDDAEDVDGSHSYDYNGVSDLPPSASGEFTKASITFTDGADMDNVGAGDPFILRVRRNPAHDDDDMSGDAQVMMYILKET